MARGLASFKQLRMGWRKAEDVADLGLYASNEDLLRPRVA
jgi:hypothetical protein